MSVDEFRQLMESHIAGFCDMWREENERDPEIYPAEFASEDDWVDQFLTFLGVDAQ